jgi:hypothetical protein
LEIEGLAKACTEPALAALKIIAAKGKSESARVAAAVALLDRGWGRPRQAVEHTGPGGGPIEVNAVDLRGKLASRIAGLASRIAPIVATNGNGNGNGHHG